VLSIFINEKPIYLGLPEEIHALVGIEAVEYNNDPKMLLPFIEAFENEQNESKSLCIYSSNLKELFKDFFDFYKVITAAGGLVRNVSETEADNFLAIYRMGVWDLPKGKIEKKEEPRDAAMREVCEETGINNLKINSFLTETYHTYWDPRKNRRVLKLSFWYLMETEDTELQAQTEEDIELAVWLPLQELKEKKPIYKNILEVIKAYEQGY
jgi:ADP-ribose pyrophosphatase YjhB (NUDIX family)